MTNHYHLVVETVEGNLTKGMRHLNGVYTQASNWRHKRVGHLFPGRYKGIVDRDAYLQELSRYVVLNPVRAGLLASPGDWPWSSYGATVGDVPVPKWLAVDALLCKFGTKRKQACLRYQRFVREGIDQRGCWEVLRQQIYLGDEKFVERMQSKAQVRGDELTVPWVQRRPTAPSLEVIAAHHEERNAATVAAYATGAYSYREIASYFGVQLATVGRIAQWDE